MRPAGPLRRRRAASARGGRRRRREPARARRPRPRPDHASAARSPATSTTTRPSGRCRSARCCAPRSTTRCCTGCRTTTTLRDGDLLSLDFAASVDGWVSDSALSVVVGTPDQRDLDLIDTTRRALDGRRSRRPSPATGSATSPRPSAPWPAPTDCAVNTQFGGHGVGRTMHGDPHVANDGRPGRGFQLQPGPGDRDRAVVPAHDRPDLHRPPTAGRSAAPTARAAPTPSTPSRSPTATRSCSRRGTDAPAATSCNAVFWPRAPYAVVQRR